MHVSSLTPPLSLDPSDNFNPIKTNTHNNIIFINNNNNINIDNNISNNLLPNINLNWLVQFLITALILGLGFLHLLRSTASKFFDSDSLSTAMSASSSAAGSGGNFCAVCGKESKSHCAACKAVYYCSQKCQRQHWVSEHKKSCRGAQSSDKLKSQQPVVRKLRPFVCLVPLRGPDIVDKVLFPYDEFLKLFNWNRPLSPPCGLLNCGNSCFANVVLQCLAHTRPLVAYLLERRHRRDCRRDEWCFLCELEVHMDRVYGSEHPFSPINVLSRLPSMGGNLGHGKQEDAHEFMRFAIDMMQSVCLDEHGGEKVIHPRSQETTLIQHIYGGQLQSQVKCTKCGQVSNQYENMMDLTVEIQGDATSLQECLDQFTAKEWLDGENLYKCDRCKDYVIASKRLTIHQAPNILTIALKRFESGIFGKINKKITFPERLDLSPYMSEERDGTDRYELYAVVVHVDMLNASFFGHYICYTKSFQGDWYWIDDCKIGRAELDEVLSQGAYMLLYKRISTRPRCLKTFEPALIQKQVADKKSTVAEDTCSMQMASSSNASEPSSSVCSTADLGSDMNKQLNNFHFLLDPQCSVSDGSTDVGSEDNQSINPVSGEPASSCSVANAGADMHQQLDHVQTSVQHLPIVDRDPVQGSLEESHNEIHASALPPSDEVSRNRNHASDSLTATIARCVSGDSTSSSGSVDVDNAGLPATSDDTLLEASGANLKSKETHPEESISEVELRTVQKKKNSARTVLQQNSPDELNCFLDRSVADCPFQRSSKKFKTA